MLTWSLNWGEITPRILVGTCPMTTADLERIGAEAGVSAVLSVQQDHCLAYCDMDYEMRTHGENLGLRMAPSPMRDFDIPDQRRNLAQAVRTLAALQSKRYRISGVVVVSNNVSSRNSEIHPPRQRLSSPHHGIVRHVAGRSVIDPLLPLGPPCLGDS